MVGRKWWLPLVGAAVSVALLAASCSSSATSKATTASLPTTPTQLPEFDVARFHDLLGHLRGKPVVINVWASWCGPCVVEAPDLAAAAREFRGRVQFLGVDVLDELGSARALIRRHGWSFPSVFDPSAAIRDDLGFIGQPETIVLDGSGNRVFTQSGAITLEDLRKELAGLG
jgi:thiol-disulfide isomerase/thioredoxin